MADDEKPSGDPAPAKVPEDAAKPDTTKPAEKAADTPVEKPAADAKPDGDGEKPASKDGPQKDAPKAPETYSLTIPDGGDVFMDATDLTALEALARKEGLTNEDAQEFVNAHVQALAAQSAGFRTAVEADPIYGGAHFPDTERYVRLVLDKLRPEGTPRGDALRTMLKKTGYGNHLEVVSFLADLGKQMAEDSPPSGGRVPAGPRDAAEVLYGDTMAKASA